MNPYQPPVLVQEEDPRIAELNAQIEGEKNRIRQACIRMGKAYYDAHINDPEETLEPDVKILRDSTALIQELRGQIRDLRGLMLCPECKAEIAKDAVFCNYCGFRLVAPEPEPVPEPEPAPEYPTVCEGCGAPLIPGQRFCTACGKPVAPVAPPQPPQPKRCPACGTELVDTAKFCYSCGAKVM